MRKCEFRKQDGKQCRAPALRGSIHCFSHEPAVRDQKQAAAAKGGRNRKAPVRPLAFENIRSLEDLTQLMYRAVGAVNSGEVELDRARTMGYLAGITAKLVETNEQANRLDDIERRLMAVIEARGENDR